MNIVEALKILEGGIWHTTSPCRYALIKSSGLIKNNPDLDDSERWNTGGGAEHYPVVRHLGGVSLFDFTEIRANNYKEYNEKHSASCVHAFVPKQAKWTEAMWIELKPEEIAAAYIDGKALLEKWKSDALYGHNILPLVEAAYIGSIPLQAFKRVLRYTENGLFVEEDFHAN